MKTLEQHNKERMEVHENARRAGEPHPNGIACPKCGKELWDSKPLMTLAACPPKKNIHCPECGYSGYRIV